MVKPTYKIKYSRQAVKDIKKLQAAGLTPKAKKLIEILRKDPFIEYPRYEALVGSLKGFYSRRINIHHRLVYKVDKKSHEVYIYRMWTHYAK